MTINNISKIYLSQIELKYGTSGPISPSSFNQYLKGHLFTICDLTTIRVINCYDFSYRII